jgi:hypothetical protein
MTAELKAALVAKAEATGSSTGRIAELEKSLEVAKQMLASSIEDSERMRSAEASSRRSNQGAQVETLTKELQVAAGGTHRAQAQLEQVRAEVRRLREQVDPSEKAAADAATAAAAADARATAAETEVARLGAELNRIASEAAATLTVTLEKHREDHEAALSDADQRTVAKVAAVRREAAQRSSSVRQVVSEKDADIKRLETELASAAKDLESGRPAERKIFEYAKAQAERDAHSHVEGMRVNSQMVELTEEVADLKSHIQLCRAQEVVLKGEIRRLESCEEREGVNLEYLKNIVVQYMAFTANSTERKALVPVIARLLAFTADDVNKVVKKSWWSSLSLAPAPRVVATPGRYRPGGADGVGGGRGGRGGQGRAGGAASDDGDAGETKGERSGASDGGGGGAGAILKKGAVKGARGGAEPAAQGLEGAGTGLAVGGGRKVVKGRGRAATPASDEEGGPVETPTAAVGYGGGGGDPSGKGGGTSNEAKAPAAKLGPGPDDDLIAPGHRSEDDEGDDEVGGGETYDGFYAGTPKEISEELRREMEAQRSILKEHIGVLEKEAGAQVHQKRQLAGMFLSPAEHAAMNGGLEAPGEAEEGGGGGGEGGSRSTIGGGGRRGGSRGGGSRGGGSRRRGAGGGRGNSKGGRGRGSNHNCCRRHAPHERHERHERHEGRCGDECGAIPGDAWRWYNDDHVIT